MPSQKRKLSQLAVPSVLLPRDRLALLRSPLDAPAEVDRNLTVGRDALRAWLGSGSASLVEFTGTSQAPQDVATGTFYFVQNVVLAKYVGTAAQATALDPTDTANWQVVIWLRQLDPYIDPGGPIAQAVLGGNFSNTGSTYGELQGTQPAGSQAGMQFKYGQAMHLFTRGSGGTLVWVRWPVG